MTQPTPKRLLIVEDDPEIVRLLDEMLNPYKNNGQIEILLADNASDALEHLNASPRPDAMILDIMMPYGPEAADPLDADSDTRHFETGIRLLEHYRKTEKDQALSHIWVAVITARSPHAVEGRVRHLLPKGREYKGTHYKPFDSFQLEKDLITALGLKLLSPDLT